MKNLFKLKTILLIILFTSVAMVGRILLQDLPNIEPIMAMSVIAGALLGPAAGLIVALASVVSSDLIIGNTNIMLFTWTAWAAIGVSATLAKRRSKGNVRVWRDTAKLTGFGLLGTIFFFLWTNFGVWYIGDWYPSTFSGLLLSYEMALPFLRQHVLSTLTIVPVASLVVLTAWKYVPVLIASIRIKDRAPSILK